MQFETSDILRVGRRRRASVRRAILTAAQTGFGAPSFAGITHWEWAADDPALGLSDTDPVTSWADLHQGLVVEQAVSSAQPQWRADFDSTGYPAVVWDGADDVLIGDSTTMDLSGGATIFIVGSLVTYTLYAGWLVLDTDGVDTDTRLELYSFNSTGSATNRIAMSNRGGAADQTDLRALNDSFPIGEVDMFTVELQSPLPTGRGMFRNRTNVGQTLGSGTDPEPRSDHTKIRLGIGYNATHGNVSAHTIIVYGSPLTPAQVTEVWDHLEARFGGPW